MKIEIHVEDNKRAYKLLLKSGYNFTMQGDYFEINEAQEKLLTKQKIRFCGYRKVKKNG